ncbi:Inosine-5'-monophosphate dehydrogenase [uncultured archaeon]|nr:Inosine-5'-monophosphate dehydrogenase [uncultured archaeon]
MEKDVEALASCGVDFIAIDGFGGGTGATDCYVRENVGIPIEVALPRAVSKLKEMDAREKITLIAGGNLRTSADFAKCLALGANAVYIGTAALIAINCEQYRICHTGLCPTGITTQNPNLVRQCNVDEGVRKLSNFLELSTHEIAAIARITGKNDVRSLSLEDIVSLDRDYAEICGCKWAGEKG